MTRKKKEESEERLNIDLIKNIKKLNKEAEENHKKKLKELNKYRFSYSMDFEYGMRHILGYGAADCASYPNDSKKLMLRALNKIRKRIDEIITMDEKLREMLFSDIEKLEKQVKEIEKVPNQMDMIGAFFSIIAHLLGYGWLSGKTYRTPIYFQTKSEEFAAYKSGVGDWREFREEEYNLILERHNIIGDLKNKGLKNNQIARVLNISEYAVRKVLKGELLGRISELKNNGLNYDEIKNKLKTEDFGLYCRLFDEMMDDHKKIYRK